jgi:transposase-like protein
MQVYAFLCAATMVYLLISVHGPPVHMPVATQRNHELAERIFQKNNDAQKSEVSLSDPKVCNETIRSLNSNRKSYRNNKRSRYRLLHVVNLEK